MIESLGIAMVKNEADVIEAFRSTHNLSFMDALVIIDNDSVDDTGKFSCSYSKRDYLSSYSTTRWWVTFRQK